jgi:hypothetical protein
MSDLKREALDLHYQLSMAYFAEDARRDDQFRPASNPAKLARLQRLVLKAADRYRRRGGWKEQSR